MNASFAFKRGTASGFLEYRVGPGEAASLSGVTPGVSGFSKLPLPPSLRGWLEKDIGGRAEEMGAELRKGRACGPATRPLGPGGPALQARLLSRPARGSSEAAPSKSNADCWNNKGRSRKMQLQKKKKKKVAVVCQTLERLVRCGNKVRTEASSLDTHTPRPEERKGCEAWAPSPGNRHPNTEKCP